MTRANSTSGIRRTLRLVRPDLKPQMSTIVFGSVALLMEVAFRVLEPWPLKIVIDAVSASLGASVYTAPATVSLLVWCALTLLLIVVLRAASNYLATVCFALAGSRVATTLRARVFDHVLSLSRSFHSRNRSADTVQRIVSDVARMQEVATTAGLPLIANVLTLVVMAIVMFILDPILALVVLAAVVAFTVISRRSTSRITHASRKTRKGEAHLANAAQESLASIEMVQAYGLENVVGEAFTKANSVSLREGVKSRRLAAGLERATDVIVGLATAIVLVGGGLRVVDGALTPGDLVLFTTYLRTTMKPLRDMAKYTGRIARAAASGERVADLMEIQPSIVSPLDPVQHHAVRGRVEFDSVSTCYENTPILKDLNLTVHPGEYVAIVGPSGSGKSTLVSLLVRSQDPTAGDVRLDGVSLRTLELADLRRNVALLHQDAVLLAGTIEYNIGLGRPDASFEDIVAAAKSAHAHEFIMDQPHGYHTLVGERGATLSGGQRQRIAIARALLRDSPVVVLDEATTGLDPAASQVVLDAIDELVEGRTTLAVTHDVDVALRATRVVWIEHGSVQMQGSPRELYETSEVFRAWVDARSEQ